MSNGSGLARNRPERDVPLPRGHEGAPLTAEFLSLAHPQAEHVTRQDVAFLAFVMLGADRYDGPDRMPPGRRADGVHGRFADDLPDGVVVGDRSPDPSGGSPARARRGRVAGLLF